MRGCRGGYKGLSAKPEKIEGILRIQGTEIAQFLGVRSRRS